MNVDLAALISAILNELDGIVENASDVFLVMIFQVIALVNNAFVFVVITTIISRSIDNMSEAAVFKYLSISCH